MGDIRMSSKEVNRINILEKLKKKELKQQRAAATLGISVRQIRRLLKRYKAHGASGITHALRGTVSNNRTDADVLSHAVAIVSEKYGDFTITMAHEKLVKHHGCRYGRETLRIALVTAGIWKPTRQQTPVVHLMRERRASEGELVQIDGSPHAWFEDRGDPCTLLVYIDDATGNLKILLFTPSETTTAYFQATRQYIERYGKPLALYSDKHGVFRVNTTRNHSAATEDSNGVTQFGRAMRELHIETIFANSPQAKGRVERVNQTLQDRLVKELRLRNISTIPEANQYLPEFMEEFNKQFAVQPKSTVNMHRPLTSTDNLDTVLVQKQRRILSKTLTVSYGNRIYQIDTDRPTYAMRHAAVTVREDTHGQITIVYGPTILRYHVVTIQQKTAITDTKHVNSTVDALMSHHPTKPAFNHPWRQPYLYW
jgi:transposase